MLLLPVKPLCHIVLAGIVLAACTFTLPAQAAGAISLNPSDYFSYSYDISFSQTHVDDGEVFYAELNASATCIKDAPVTPSEAYVNGRVVARHLETGRRFSLNSGYSSTISPVPSSEGETFTDSREVPMHFPWDSPPGEYEITAELIEAKIKAGGLWFDVSGSLPQTQNMGRVYYKMPEPEPEPTPTPTPSPTPTPTPTPTPSPTPTPTPEPESTPTPTPSPEPTPTPTPEPEPDPTPTDPPEEPTTPTEPEVPEGAAGLKGETDSDGRLTANLELATLDGRSRLNLEKGTRIGSSDDASLPAWIMLTSLSEAPEGADESQMVGPACQIKPLRALFEPHATLSLDYYPAQIPAGMDATSLVIARWDEDGKKWVVLEESRVDASSNSVTAPVTQAGSYAILAPVSPPDFELSEFLINPEEAASGQMVSIECRVKNRGTAAGYYEATLKLNGEIQEVRRITLDGGSSRVISFGVVRYGAGTYAVDLNGLTGVYTVTDDEYSPPPVPSAPQNGGGQAEYGVWAIYALNAVLLLVICFLGRGFIKKHLAGAWGRMRGIFSSGG